MIRGKNQRPRLMFDFKTVFKKRSKQTVTCIGKLLLGRFVCEASRTSPDSAMQVIARGCFDIPRARVVRIRVQARAADHHFVVGLNGDALVKLWKGEGPIQGAHACSFRRARSNGARGRGEKYTPCEILGGRTLIIECRVLARGRGRSRVGRAGRRRHTTHRFHTGHPIRSTRHQPKSRCGRDEGGETVISSGHCAVIARGSK